jgi:hypothetical protein
LLESNLNLAVSGRVKGYVVMGLWGHGLRG